MLGGADNPNGELLSYITGADKEDHHAGPSENTGHGSSPTSVWKRSRQFSRIFTLKGGGLPLKVGISRDIPACGEN